jgi:hypothetical protein
MGRCNQLISLSRIKFVNNNSNNNNNNNNNNNLHSSWLKTGLGRILKSSAVVRECCLTFRSQWSMSCSTKGSQRVPAMLVLHCNGRTYGNAYLITFKARSLYACTLAPSIPPLLQAPAQGLFWNLPESGRRVRFEDLHGYETCPLEDHFQSRGQPKVTRSEIRRVL